MTGISPATRSDTLPAGYLVRVHTLVIAKSVRSLRGGPVFARVWDRLDRCLAEPISDLSHRYWM
jgi:hypothetical protein